MITVTKSKPMLFSRMPGGTQKCFQPNSSSWESLESSDHPRVQRSDLMTALTRAVGKYKPAPLGCKDGFEAFRTLSSRRPLGLAGHRLSGLLAPFAQHSCNSVL